jgi:acyl-CoA thioesterase
MESDEAQRIAERIGVAMNESDRVGHALGITLEIIRPGFARVLMKVREDMLNGFGICHGGITFTLADVAFAYACNSRNRKTLALACNINYSSSAMKGDTLTATAEERLLSGRIGVCDVTVTNQNDVVIAHFRGTSYGTGESFQANL